MHISICVYGPFSVEVATDPTNIQNTVDSYMVLPITIRLLEQNY